MHFKPTKYIYFKSFFLAGIIESKILKNGEGHSMRNVQVMFENELHVVIDVGDGKSHLNYISKISILSKELECG